MNKVVYPPANDAVRLVTDSEKFPGVKYEVRDGHLVIWTLKDGILAVQLEAIKQFAEELREMADVWGTPRA
jgi:hypothetical protein